VRVPIAVVARSFSLYAHDECTVYAAAISYYALFSLIPLTLLTLAGFGYFVDQDRLVDFLFDQLPLEESAGERERVEGIIEQSRKLSEASALVAIPVLLWTSSGLFAAVRRGLNATEHFRTTRPLWRAKLLDLAMVPSLGVLILVSVTLTAVAQVVLERAGDLGPLHIDTSGLVELAVAVPAALISFTMFTLVYRFVPHAHPGWSEALTSAALATLLFEALKLAGAIILRRTDFATDTGIYAGVGIVFVFLFWVYLNATILLFCAEFGQAIFDPSAGAERREHGRDHSRLRRMVAGLRAKEIHDA
jgi:membrane protein